MTRSLDDELDEIDYDLLPFEPLDRISLPPNKNNTNRYTNELFDATNSYVRPITSSTRNSHEVIPPDQKFLEEVDFELDDVMRTRVFNNRFKRPIDEINPELSEYFRIHQDNKENLGYKVKKPTLRRKSLPLVETNNIQKKPHLKRAPKASGVCQPRHQSLTPSKSCLSIEDAKVYLIESSTGLVNQATDFATELNGCTNETLPFPEHENEVVQIPTNSGDAQQMAIIRMFNIKLAKARKGIRTGFYSEKEFQEYQAKLKQEAANAIQNAGVQVVSQEKPREDSSKDKRVKWADKLEW
ncbi:hypothetical protein I9W82_001550 [Candida metapsilosis]|uniref:Uncharacterized protein n=1 Tax=Candida metapsilosis TaxID=273372 RepID=A0A8H7ZHI3_9ASCO|nr:hypothetical protein I9W82_001550 [Candida metapsilosis]